MNRKRNLFICHSQNHLATSIGLSSYRFMDDLNDLILFTDFAVNRTVESNIHKNFNRVLQLDGIYPRQKKKWLDRGFRLLKEVRQIRTFVDKYRFDNLFLVLDGNFHEMYVIKCLDPKKKETTLNWIEDGVYPYYRNVVDRDGFNSNKYTLQIRKVLFKYFLMLGDVYDFYDVSELGTNKHIKRAYLSLPGKHRDFIYYKEVVKINEDEIICGYRKLFKGLATSNIEMSEIKCIIVLDNSNVYKHKTEQVLFVLNKILLENEGVYVKLHPREEMLEKAIDKRKILAKNLPVEYYFSNIDNGKALVLGFLSTGLFTAKIFGFKTFSLAKYVGLDRANVNNFFKEVGIGMLDLSNIKDILR